MFELFQEGFTAGQEHATTLLRALLPHAHRAHDLGFNLEESVRDAVSLHPEYEEEEITAVYTQIWTTLEAKPPESPKAPCRLITTTLEVDLSEDRLSDEEAIRCAQRALNWRFLADVFDNENQGD